MSSDREIGYAAVAFGFGLWSFFKGFTRLRRKRLIENTPTSTVRGLAMGLVELIGKAGKTRTFTSPLTHTECVFYRYTVERYESSGRSGHWVVIAKGDSNYCPLWLDDGTGKVMVFPQGAELIMPIDYQFETGFGKSLSNNLVDFMQQNGLRYEGFFGSASLRFKEWFLVPEETICVLGTAQPTGGQISDHKAQLIQRLTALKGNPQKMADVDTNKDGSISVDEWNQAASKVEQELLEEELRLQASGDSVDVVIGKGEAGQVFIISDESQTQLIKSLSWQAFLGVCGGAALSLAMLAYLVYRLSAWTRLEPAP